LCPIFSDAQLQFGKTHALQLSSADVQITVPEKKPVGLLNIDILGRSIISNQHAVLYYSIQFDYRDFTSRISYVGNDIARSENGTYTVS